VKCDILEREILFEFQISFILKSRVWWWEDV